MNMNVNIETEIKSILEKFIIHLYDDFDFEETHLKIQSELKDDYYTEEELYDMYYFGCQYVRNKFLININRKDIDLDILEKICQEQFENNYYVVLNVILEKLLLYYIKYYGDDAQRLINKLIAESKGIKYIIMDYLSFYYCENQSIIEIIINSVINVNLLK